MAELIWDGKYDEHGNKRAPVRIELPFQTVETVNESAQDRQRTLELSASGNDPEWRNRLIWGDKKYVLPSLLPECAGKVGLIYIDPPYDTGSDFSFATTIPGSDQSFVKEASLQSVKFPITHSCLAARPGRTPGPPYKSGQKIRCDVRPNWRRTNDPNQHQRTHLGRRRRRRRNQAPRVMSSRPLHNLRRKATRRRRSRPIRFSELLPGEPGGRLRAAVYGETTVVVAYPDRPAKGNAGTSATEEASCTLFVNNELFVENKGVIDFVLAIPA